MNQAAADEIARLNAALAQDTTSEHLRERLLELLSADQDGYKDPRRFELIAWFVKNNPRHYVLSTPYARVDPLAAPDAYRDLKTEWLAWVNESPGDSQLAQGAALFIAAENEREARVCFAQPLNAERTPQNSG